MIAVILAGGFAKRMWPLTENQPKALLPIAGRPIIEYIIDKIMALDGIDKILVSTNKKFESHFREWLSGFSQDAAEKIKLVVEPTLHEGEKFGAIKAWDFLIKQEHIQDDIISIAGDNLFEFDLRQLMDFFREKKEYVIALYDVREKSEAKKFGVVETDKDSRVTGFSEKPENPKTTLCSTGVYIFPKEKLGMISEYLKGGENPDAPGHFIAWLHRKLPVFGFVFRENWFDIGSFEKYKEADEFFRKK